MSQPPSEDHLRLVLEAARIGSWEWDAEAGLLTADAVYQSLFGLPAQKEPRPVEDYWAQMVPEETAAAIEIATAALKHGAEYQMERRVIRPDGEVVWIHSRGRAKPDDPTRMIGVSFDITDRKRAEAALRESDERFQQFAKYSTEVLSLIDVETSQHIFISSAYERVWGVAPEAVWGLSHWLETIHPDDRERTAAGLNGVFHGEAVVLEYRILRPDGAVRWVRDTFFPISDGHGRVRRVGGIAQDITISSGSLVYVIDADDGSREPLRLLLQGAGYDVRVFASAQAFLQMARALIAGCVVLDIRAAEAGGLAVPQELKARRIHLPVIVLGMLDGDVGLAVRAMKAGAADVLPIPYDRETLLLAVASALAGIREGAERDRAAMVARARIAHLTVRERQVLDGMLAGGTNKSMGRDLRLSPRTVEIHRAHLMERLGAKTLPEAVLMAAAAGVRLPYPIEWV